MKMNIENIGSVDLRDFAKTMGWTVMPEAIQDRLFVLNNPNFPKRQLIFPVDKTDDYEDIIIDIFNKIAYLTNRSVDTLYSNFLDYKDDSLRFRIVNSKNDDSFIPLTYALSALDGAQKMLLSAAHTVLDPKLHHPKLKKSEARQFLEKCNFKHTEPGSFILKVSCPVNAIEGSTNLFSDSTEDTFVRKTTLVTYKALNSIVNSIVADDLQNFVDGIKSGINSEISSNFCEAIVNFQEETRYDLNIEFNWSSLITPPSNTNNIIKIQKDYFSRIKDIGIELKSQETPREDTYIGTVETLNGEMNTSGKRAGEVIFNLLIDDEAVRAKATLDETQYAEADRAHMTEGAYIKIKATLNQGRQPRTLNGISEFELIEPK